MSSVRKSSIKGRLGTVGAVLLSAALVTACGSAEAKAGTGPSTNSGGVASLPCGHPYASAPAAFYLDKAKKVHVPRHGTFVVVLTRDCSAKVRITKSTGVSGIHKFQGLAFADKMHLTAKRATLTVREKGKVRHLTLIGGKS